jgi:hypothetical protein
VRSPKGRFVPGEGGGAPKGNRNAAKDRIWRKALNAELKKYADPERGIKEGEALNAIARKCVEDALSNDPDVRLPSRQEIANRLDGKPTEHIEAEFTQRLAEELTDEQLLDIARGGSDGAAEEEVGETESPELH